MQLKNLKIFVSQVLKEGRRLQNQDVNGRKLTKRRFTDTNIISFIVAILGIVYLKNGFSDNFAGYLISFLAIFVGLFTSINISLYEKKNSILQDYNGRDQVDKVRLLKMKNYLLQFSGLVSYSIVIALAVIVMLLIVLLGDTSGMNVYKYRFIKDASQLNLYSIILFMQGASVLMYRFLLIKLICTFFVNTLYAVTSYFSFLQSEYKNIRLKDEHLV